MLHKPRVVFDTNIFISAIIFGGNPRMCLDFAREGKIQLFSSKALLLELVELLRSKFEYGEDDLEEVIAGISKFTEIVQPKVRINIIKKDLKDNAVLEVALEAKPDYIISGDKNHLLALGKFKGVRIITAAEFIKLVDVQD